MKDWIKKHSKPVLITSVVTLTVGSVITVSYLSAKLEIRTKMLNAAMDVIEDLDGVAEELIPEKILSY